MSDEIPNYNRWLINGQVVKIVYRVEAQSRFRDIPYLRVTEDIRDILEYRKLFPWTKIQALVIGASK